MSDQRENLDIRLGEAIRCLESAYANITELRALEADTRCATEELRT